MNDAVRLEVVEEQVILGKEEVETGRVRVDLRTREREETVTATLRNYRAEIERVPVGMFVDEPPPVRQEGDFLVVPVLEEVVTIRLRLVEEIRIRRVETTRDHSETVILRREEAFVEKMEPK